jgi:HSP20 family protein
MLPTITRRSYKPFFMSNFFDNDFFPEFSGRTSTLPAVNISEDEKSFKLALAVPGIDKKELKIEINDDLLTISSEKRQEKEEETENYKRKEFSYSSFCRSFYLPEEVKRDKIDAVYTDGILTVTLPKDKQEKENLTRQITIS